MRGTRTVELSIYPLFGLLNRENLGHPHPVFAGGERYVSHRFADAAERELRERLAESGLGHRDALGDFLDTLALIQRASMEFFGWVSHGERKYRVLAASLGRRAVVVTADRDRVTFEGADPDRLGEALLYRLPEVRPGAGEPFSVREADLGQKARREPGAVLRRTAPNRPDGARRFEMLMREPRHGGAKLYAAARDRGGVRRRSTDWLTLLDLEVGRWLVYSSGRGERALNAVPGTPQILAAKLGELTRSLG